jgi:hypothetical protein
MGEQKRKRREVVVTKALLLGYSFPETESGTIALYDPNGNEVMGCTHKAGKSFGPYFLRFPTRWMAADKALELAGVKPDAPVAR